MRSSGWEFRRVLFRSDALVDGRNVFLRHDAADDRVLELIALALLVRRDLEPDMAELALAARLANELAFGLERLADRLAVGDLRLADLGLDVELALHAVDEDVQVQIANAGEDGLAGLFVGLHAERRRTAEGRGGKEGGSSDK